MTDQPHGTTHPPGSPEDIKLAIENLQKFFTAKLRHIEMHSRGMAITDGTATKSVCSVDGTDDGDD